MSRQFQPLFVLDTNVFIGAHNGYYAPAFCPAFWDCVIRYFHAGRLISIDQVFTEITGPSGLVRWVQSAPGGLFVSSQEQPVRSAYGTIMNWARNESQFKPAAIDRFAEVADGWLVAYAQVHSAVVVTHERFAADAKSRVLIPNVCKQFNVDYLNTFEMLRQLGVQFDLRPTT